MNNNFNSSAARTEKQVVLDKLVVAIEENNTAEARRLLQTGLVDIAETDKYISTGFTALGFATYRGYTALAQMLIEEAQADIEATDTWGYTPLMRAAMGDNLHMAQLLVGKGASLEARNDRGETAMELALNRRSGRMEALLNEAEENRAAEIRGATARAAESLKAAHAAIARKQALMRIHKPTFTIKAE